MSQHSLEALQANALETSILLRGDAGDLWIDRLFNMDFLSDQMFTIDDQMAPAFHISALRDAMRYGYHGHII